mmetsp:Transcript_42713/g.110065  ORF Transcript_42713/g.110065 Transcript_42713/m.110065 type:complete len:97 (-) Transcript_42713:522-812(-)
MSDSLDRAERWARRHESVAGMFVSVSDSDDDERMGEDVIDRLADSILRDADEDEEVGMQRKRKDSASNAASALYGWSAEKRETPQQREIRNKIGQK